MGLLAGGIGIGLGVPFLALTLWFPTMRYELDADALTLRYGPVLTYRIPLNQVQSVERRNLRLSLWSSVRLPGVALFSVPYRGLGQVKMCPLLFGHPDLEQGQVQQDSQQQRPGRPHGRSPSRLCLEGDG